MKFVIFLVLILQLQALWVDSSPTTTPPGFMLPLTKKGLERINDVAQTALDNELKVLKIPDRSGHDGHINWSADAIYGRGVTIPSSAMAFSPSTNAISWTMKNLGVVLYSDWRAEYKKGWLHVSSSGSVDLKVMMDSLQATLHLVQTAGRPSVSLAKCDASMGDVEAKFHGGSRILVNLFRGVIGDESKKLMQGQICKIIETAVNVRVNAKLNPLKGNSEIDHQYLLDYNHPHS